MRIPRIHTDQPLSPGSQITLGPRETRHLAQVLRLKRGAEITLFDGSGYDYPAVLTECTKRQAVASLGSRSAEETQPPLSIHLGIGVSRGERMDYALQKSVELGVSEVTPLFTERSVVRLQGERLQKRTQHWSQVIISACEQSGRNRLPTLHTPDSLEGWLPSGSGAYALLLDHRSTSSMCDMEPPVEKIRLLIGPEGGLSEGERQLAQENGFRGVRLGPRVMRTETAPLAAIAAIQTLWGDFR
jgi:16S rRNA (uracil1498-N3)-methyltransferase